MPTGVYVRTKERETRPLEQRFWPKVQKGPGCWFWIAGGDGPDGYGRVRIGGKGTLLALAHRVAWELTNGPVPDGMFVCHHCDTPRCVRPDHLFLGTHADNMADASQKGRLGGERWYQSRPQRRNWQRDGRPSRARADAVTLELRWAVVKRDGMCVLAKLFPDHVCRDKWGEIRRPDDRRSLSIEHLKDDLRMGKRGPSDLKHMVAICYGANVGVPSKVERQAMREYLLPFYPEEVVA